MQECTKLGMNYPCKGSILFVQTSESRGPTLEEMETPLKSRKLPLMTVSPGYPEGAPITASTSIAPMHGGLIPMSYTPYEETVLHLPPATAIPNTSKFILVTLTEHTIPMPPTGPTYTYATSPLTTLGSAPLPPTWYYNKTWIHVAYYHHTSTRYTPRISTTCTYTYCKICTTFFDG
ncbi:hypothetical protein GOP47_0025358 [Adiantum capillus-veneris]|uniref:Uncharacterized protein n=1 Tax=Adiantum capillus-veneris TaxID=13818 RepID=A0A9D4U209_ADICA|nr:hypothetical protein GOP47_0025358 [Adiantum capillus-veneris]